ncbi:glycosyltransferase family 2 protein [Luteococcus sanguinis]|uniref:Glycosyltransferase family 2 protein n=1 Tax=Luteococcus sanguinis TaxID=174038 RepID=A0ABW1X438_9ACTN
MNQPLISVITPARNAEKYLGSCLDGVRAQTWENVEHVVVNDGSTDRTGALLDLYADELTVVHSTGEGVSAARNRAVAASRGEYIALCDADDVLLPRHLETAMAKLSQGDRAFVTCDAYLLTTGGFDPKRTVLPWGSVPGKLHRLGILEANFVSIFTVMPRAMWDELGGMSTSLRYNEDWDLWMRAIHAGWEMRIQAKPEAMYRWTPGSAMTNVDKVIEAEDRMMETFLAEHADTLQPDELDYVNRRIKDGNPRVVARRGDDALREGDYATARESFNEAALLLPHDRKVQAKAASMRLVPPTARLWQRRLLHADRATGRDVHER